MSKSLKVIIYIVLVIVCMVTVTNILKFKYGDGVYMMENFYEQEENTVDVLVLGSSHAFESVNTGILYDEYGVAAYNLCGPLQPMWNTYYYLKEALKTQTPKLIVLEAYTTSFTDEYANDTQIIKNTYGMKWSKDKIEALKVSAPKERWLEFFVTYGQYHTRYQDLSEEDFLGKECKVEFEYYKGFSCSMKNRSYEESDVASWTSVEEMTEKTEKYYRMTIELAKEAGIPIVIVVAPYSGINEEHQSRFNMAEIIAAEYDVPFRNYNLMYDELNINFETDFADIEHLNYLGNQKFTRNLGDYLKQNYEIPDRRGDEKYVSWEKSADYYEAKIHQHIASKSKALDEILDYDFNNYIVVISIDGYCDLTNEKVKQVMNTFGIDEYNSGDIWMIDSGEILFSSRTSTDTVYYHEYELKNFMIENSIEEGVSNQIVIDNKNYEKVADGVNIMIYSKYTNTVADAFGINALGDYNIVRD